MKRLIKIFFLLHIVFISKGQIAINNINYKTNNFDDLEFLKDFIKEKRIVCLGEEWHGNETFNEVKNRIVKYLHKELEFEVIIFESGIYGSYIANIENLNEKERLFETLPTIWRTESVLNLINYIDSVSRNTSLLIQMGLDIGGAYTDRFPNYLHKFFSAVSQIVADSVFSIDIELQRKWVMWQSSFNTKGILDNKEKIVYQHYYNFLISLLDSQNEKLSLSETQNLLLKTCLKSRIKLCDLLSIKDSTTAGFRDKVMSENLLHFIKEIYPEKKIIIWAAHGHISKSAKDTYSTKDNIESMIELLPTEIKDTILCIDLKPFESAPKPIKKRLLKCEDDVVFFKTHTPAYELYEFEKLKSEFDGIIFCRNKKSINNYAILQNEYKK